MRTGPRLPLPALLVASAPLLFAAGVGALPCPNYPYPPQDDRCVGEGFCARVDPEASAGTAQDRPGPSKTEDSVPVLQTAGAAAGTSSPAASGEADALAGRGLVQAVSHIECSAPATTSLEDAAGRASTVTTFRVTDLVFSGPTSDVETSLHVVFEPSYAMTTTGDDADERGATAAVLVGGGICGGGQIVGFEGQRQVSQTDAVGGAPMLSFPVNSGLLEDAPLDAPSALTIGPFTAPTGVPLQIELWMSTTTSAHALGGEGDADSSFLFSLPLDGSPVFDLPAGYTADSEDGGIVANAVPEPRPVLLTIAGAIVLLARRRWRRASVGRFGGRRLDARRHRTRGSELQGFSSP
jgi:hypothetical protein